MATVETVGSTWRRLFDLVRPGKIVCVGLNYRQHAAESTQELPPEPLLFGKFANTVIDSGELIRIPPGSGHVDAEAELAVVIGRRAHNVDEADALEHVHGYTLANDVSAREIQFADGQWFRGKGFDTFCPLLGKVVPVEEVGGAANLLIVQRLNGEVLQDDRTSSMIFDVPALVSYVSGVLTLEPGDVVLTGTPEGCGYFRTPRVDLQHGDVVEVEIESIGVLTNPVERLRDEL